jgi:hypothetical protein
MPNDLRVDELVGELPHSGGSPEDACHSCPELLPHDRAALHRLRALEHDVNALFPTPPGMATRLWPREVSPRAEAAVRSGLMTAGDGADSIIRALGLGVKASDGSTRRGRGGP